MPNSGEIYDYDLMGALAAEQNMHEVFDEWIKPHVGGRITALPYDPQQYPHQKIEVCHIAPNPSLEIACFLGQEAFSAKAYEKLVSELQELVGEIKSRAIGGHSTLVATAHLRNTFDTALSHNALFVASEDESFANTNLIVANKLMTRMAIGGVAVTEILRVSGHVLLGIPRTGAQKYGLDKATITKANQMLNPYLTDLMGQGAAFHRALSDTRAKDIIMADGEPAKMLPTVSRGMARMTCRSTPHAVAVGMDVTLGDSKAKVLEPRYLEADNDVHLLMHDLADAEAELADEIVVYGLPEGAKVVEI